ncbi:hypothetical protein HMPREF0083_03293 [Aneurinibacillus aneurinilyticus ATCC 12856]|uniref:Uncharacterized protein n=1 Tax=Aneurinibacillus aneurinilyticus ATCC 12856 TaxID=649747 RepID=U1X0Q8_ANEAE|nr:hypothetical protein HMPREF0083_03293 [Aneurinibacillus aneurinilyticus ATCC 12856]
MKIIHNQYDFMKATFPVMDERCFLYCKKILQVLPLVLFSSAVLRATQGASNVWHTPRELF